jgi:hypothetical protein
MMKSARSVIFAHPVCLCLTLIRFIAVTFFSCSPTPYSLCGWIRSSGFGFALATGWVNDGSTNRRCAKCTAVRFFVAFPALAFWFLLFASVFSFNHFSLRLPPSSSFAQFGGLLDYRPSNCQRLRWQLRRRRMWTSLRLLPLWVRSISEIEFTNFDVSFGCLFHDHTRPSAKQTTLSRSSRLPSAIWGPTFSAIFFSAFLFTPQSATHLVRWMNFDFRRPSLLVCFLVVVFSHVLIYS